MPMIEVEPGITEKPEIPLGQPLMAELSRVENRSGESERGEWKAVIFSYIITDPEAGEAQGAYISEWCPMRKPARKYVSNCQAIGVPDPKHNWDPEAFIGAKVVITAKEVVRNEEPYTVVDKVWAQ